MRPALRDRPHGPFKRRLPAWVDGRAKLRVIELAYRGVKAAGNLQRSGGGIGSRLIGGAARE
ncbi:hypothetical protein GCM10010525_19900 [Glutamicibacter bergerei]